MSASSSASHVDEEETNAATAPTALTVYEMLKPEHLNKKARVPSMTCRPARVHRGHHDAAGRFDVNPAFLLTPEISCEIFAIRPQKLALAITLTPQQGSARLIGTFGSPWPSLQCCYVGKEPAIQIIDTDTTLSFKQKLLPTAAFGQRKSLRLAEWPKPAQEAYYSQPKCAWWILVFSEKAERDQIFAEIFGHGLLGAVARLPIARCADDRTQLADAMNAQDYKVKDKYAMDPRPQVDGHKPFDEYWRRL